MNNDNNCDLVSVIMPVYNGEKYLRTAIESVLKQTYSNLEFIIINDCSNDSTESIIQSYDDERIRYYKNLENLHVARSLNYAITLSRGGFIARMDADDICHPDRIMQQVCYMKKHPELDGCGTWAHIIDSMGNKNGILRCFSNAEMTACASMFTVPFVHPSVMFRASVIRDNPYSPEMKGAGQDQELWSRLSLSGYRFANLPQRLLFYRVHKDNVTAHNIDKAYTVVKHALYRSLCDYFQREVSDEEFALHRYSFLLTNQHYRQTLHKDKDFLKKECLWLEGFWLQNNSLHKYDGDVLMAFLHYRWFLCCSLTRNWGMLFAIKMGRFSLKGFYYFFRFFARI